MADFLRSTAGYTIGTGMKKLLLVSGSEKNIEAFRSMVSSAFDEIETGAAYTAASAGRLMEQGQYDAMLVNTPLKDGSGLELGVYVCEKLFYPVILVTNHTVFDKSADTLTQKGITVFARPLDRSSFMAVLGSMISVSSLIQGLRENNQKLQRKLEEGRLVSRAKAMLIRDMNMTESQAHRYIEKQAMNLRLTKMEVAQNLLRTYYNK